MIKTYTMMIESLNHYLAPTIKLGRMVKNGEIIKLTKGLYETNPSTDGHLVANAIYGPSYLSFDYALAYHHLIPETVYTYTSATFEKKKKKKFINPLGTYTYQDVPSLAYPVEVILVQEGDYHYLIASKEKALCDKLYTLSPVRNKSELKKLLFEDLRIDVDEFVSLNINILQQLCPLYHNTNIKILVKVKGDFNENYYPTND